MKKLFFLMLVMTIVFSSCQNEKRYRLLFDSEACQGTMILITKDEVPYQTLANLHKELEPIVVKDQATEDITTAVYQSLRKFIGSDDVDFDLSLHRENVKIKIHGLNQTVTRAEIFSIALLMITAAIVIIIAFGIVTYRKSFERQR